MVLMTFDAVARHTRLPSTSPPATFVFGEFRLDQANATLLRHDLPVALTPKAFSVLEYLAQHAGRLVTKDEFMATLWPDVFVGDAALKVCVREIRRALGDDPQHPRFVETAHRRGYRFIAPVKIITSTTADAPLVDTGHSEALPARVAEPQAPPTRYAKSGDVNIAYQVIGDGPIDLVFVMGWVSHIDYFWREPSFAKFLHRLASFSRLILFDKRGTGLSDRVVELPTLEQRMDDVRAVLDAVGSRQAALLGVSEGGPLCSLYATTYPERTLALVMIGTYAKRQWAPDYPWAPTSEQRAAFLDEIQHQWGGPVGLGVRAPSMVNDTAFRDWWSTYLRMGASPGAALALTTMNAEIDIRHVLPAIRVPTLILHRVEDRCLNIEEARYIAGQIPGATLVELPGDDHLPFVGDQEAMLTEIERFLEGRRDGVDANRVLATIVSADVTEAASAGVSREAFEAHARKEVEWYRGRLLDLSASRLQAAFDGPARAIRCATSLVAAAPRFHRRMRAGLHTGECEVEGLTMRGSAVELSSRLSQTAVTGDVLVSRTVRDLVAGSGLVFEPRGSRQLADDGGQWEVFAARGTDHGVQETRG
jgi:pimeloyl-ACP methyl ester carboxylesterase/DNA-binding winged helix-turn-helix (wHTH) protein/class 3 adenylate cyclase